jgi:glycosyl-4,4'-diaponeurosporenoate acyltransferase
VRRWKDRLPEAGTWFGGVSKRHLPSLHEGGRARFAAESLRAERVHFVLLAVIPLTMTWSRGWWVVINLAFGITVNLPCIIVARYNRIRLARLSFTDANS